MLKKLTTAGVAIAFSLAVAMSAKADFIVYGASAFFVDATLGSHVFNSCTGSGLSKCAEVSIVATSDTSFVVPFSVPGAAGFENFHLSNIMLTIDDPPVVLRSQGFRI